MYSFPFAGLGHRLNVGDFQRFSRSFAEILLKRLPTAAAVIFLPPGSQGITGEGGLEVEGSLRQAMQARERVCAVVDGRLLVPFFTAEEAMVLAVVSGADPLFLAKLGEDWLEEVKAAVEREFLLLKEARCDAVTGLLNLWNLQSLLESEERLPMHLLLVELPPKRLSCRFALRYTQRCAGLLGNFLQHDSLLHYLGNAIFALVLPQPPGSPTLAVERALLAYLKREGCHRAHIGSSVAGEGEHDPAGSGKKREPLDQAWTALRQAEKRGPFSFCAYSRLSYPEGHPLSPPALAVTRRFAALVRSCPRYSAVQFRCQDGGDASVVVGPALGGRKWLSDGRDAVVFLPGEEGEAAQDWAAQVVRRLRQEGQGRELMAGVCAFPCGDFSRSEVLLNCRKALYHATFLADAEAVLFDAVSLNISGDVYFGDGDLARAVSEYRRGLKLDGSDVNLHNSLGVTWAMMDKPVAAAECFARALACGGDNFMALYNLGLVEQRRRRPAAAYAWFQRALQHFERDAAAPEALGDLLFQAGMLAGELGRCGEAIEYLLRWRRDHASGQRAAAACYHLGRAYAGRGESGPAVVELQRALQFDGFDDRAMSLLGMLYLHAGEGNDIALALCRKSVDLEPGNAEYRCNLAEVLIHCGEYPEARRILRTLLGHRGLAGRTRSLMARCCLLEGEARAAELWQKRAAARLKRPADAPGEKVQRLPEAV